MLIGIYIALAGILTAEFLILVVTFCYLSREYSKVKDIVVKANNELTNNKTTFPAQKKSSLKKPSQKNIIKLNVTQRMDTEKINSRLEYAQLNFMQNGKNIFSEKMSQDRIRIGRDYRNDIRIKEPTVSRRQCIISKRDNKFVLRNFAEKNITRLNGKIVKDKAELRYGDIIEMGKITLRFDDITSKPPLEENVLSEIDLQTQYS